MEVFSFELVVRFPEIAQASSSLLGCCNHHHHHSTDSTDSTEHAPGADSVRWEGLCLQQSPEAVSPRGALGPGGLWFLVMCTLDGPSLA